MGFFDRLFGTEPARQAPPPEPRRLSEDELAVNRYRYLLRTAPPESIEAVHAEAFAKLTPEQRRLVYEGLTEQMPAGEQLASDRPDDLARAATRAELRQPGSMERAFGSAEERGRAAGPSFGQMFGSSLLGSIAGVVVGSALVQAFLPDPGMADAGADGGAEGDPGADAGGAEAASADGGDLGGDFGGFGDFGGGDFGDFGF